MDEIEAARLINLGWDLQIVKATRDALQEADFLAKLGQGSNRQLQILEAPPAGCSDQILDEPG